MSDVILYECMHDVYASMAHRVLAMYACNKDFIIIIIIGHFRQMVNLAIIFKSLANGFHYGTIFKIHACINWNYIEYIIMIA